MIESMKSFYAVDLLCETMEVSRSGYYCWKRSGGGIREREDKHLRDQIRVVFKETRQSYGYPRMTLELRERGHSVGKSRVARLMREEGLCGSQKKRFGPMTTQSNHDRAIAPNRLAELAKPTTVNRVWRSDITYLRTAEGWLYLCTVLDSCSRRIIGWAFSPSLQSGFVVAALRMAVARRGTLPEGLIVHSDRGVQYASQRFREELRRHGMLASMSRKGHCYDNAEAEAFFSTLKRECVYRYPFATRTQARHIVFEWIEAFYNLKRRHSALGYQSPVDFENLRN